jgi:hypothetical protein
MCIASDQNGRLGMAHLCDGGGGVEEVLVGTLVVASMKGPGGGVEEVLAWGWRWRWCRGPNTAATTGFRR